jgi:hypothetical protein
MINISPHTLIRDIQWEFNFFFPFLKIDFFRQAYSTRNKTGKFPCLSGELSIGAAYTKNKEAVITIDDITTMRALEKECAEQFGISVQIYRKLGNIWLETSRTDSWTMKQQNRSGLELFTLLKERRLE